MWLWVREVRAERAAVGEERVARGEVGEREIEIGAQVPGRGRRAMAFGGPGRKVGGRSEERSQGRRGPRPLVLQLWSRSKMDRVLLSGSVRSRVA